MAGQIKGINIKFSADMSELTGDLKKAQGALSKTQAELRDLNRALKFNPRNTTLLEQKFNALKRSVTETDAKLKELKNLQKQMDDKGIDKTSAQYKELQREIIKTENNLKQAKAQLKSFGSVGKQQVMAVGNQFKSAGNKIKSAGRTMTTTMSVYGAMGIYTGSRLIEMSEKQTQAENKLVEIYKKRMGANKKAAKSTMDLASALQKQGVVGDEVALSFAQQMATYSSAPSTVNKLMPAFENLLVQQKGLNGTQEDAVGLANMFGKAMMGQTGALKRAGISFTEAQEEVLKYGTEEEKAAMMAEVVTQNVGEMNEKFAKTDAGKIQQAKNAIGDMGEEIGAVLIPAVADLVGWFQTNLMPKIQQFIDFMKQHPQLATFALAIAGITAVLGPLVMGIGGLIVVIGSLVTTVTALDIALAPIVGTVALIVAAIAAAIAIGVILYKNWDVIKKFAIKTWGNIKKAILKAVTVIKAQVVRNFTTIKTKAVAIWTGIKTKISSVVTGIKTKVSAVFSNLRTSVSNTWQKIKEAITKPITKAKDTVSKIIKKIKSLFPLKVGRVFSNLKLPHFSVKGKAPFGIGGKGVKPSIGIDWYAKGGIFNSPSIIGVGERGAEAVLPIDKLQTMLNASNSQMVSALITALRTTSMGADGGEFTITVNLGGAKVATEVYKLSKQGKMILEA